MVNTKSLSTVVVKLYGESQQKNLISLSGLADLSRCGAKGAAYVIFSVKCSSTYSAILSTL